MLTRAVNSVLRQTYGDVELIIVDDGSERDIESHLRNDFGFNRLQVVKNTRSPGASGARNTGFYHSRGALVAFLDDDDEWMPEKIRKQVEVFQSTSEKVGIVCTADVIMQEGGVIQTRSRDLRGDVFQTLCQAHLAGNTSNPLIKRNVLEHVGLFDESLSAAQDTDLWIRIAKHYHFATVNEPLTLIYWHDAERIGKNNHRQVAGVSKLLQKHWADLPVQRKYALIKRIMRLSMDIAKHKIGINQ